MRILAITQLQHRVVISPLTSFSHFGRKFFSVGAHKDSSLLSEGWAEPVGDEGIPVLPSNGM